jgi:hypothetical protein
VDTTNCNNKNRYNEHECHGTAFRFKGGTRISQKERQRETLIFLFEQTYMSESDYCKWLQLEQKQKQHGSHWKTVTCHRFMTAILDWRSKVAVFIFESTQWIWSYLMKLVYHNSRTDHEITKTMIYADHIAIWELNEENLESKMSYNCYSV